MRNRKTALPRTPALIAAVLVSTALFVLASGGCGGAAPMGTGTSTYPNSSTGTPTGGGGGSTGGGGGTAYPTRVECCQGTYATGWFQENSRHDGEVFISKTTPSLGFIKIDLSDINPDAELAGNVYGGTLQLHFYVISSTVAPSVDVCLTFGDPQTVANVDELYAGKTHADLESFSEGWNIYDLGWPGKSSFEKVRQAISEGRGFITFLFNVPC